MENTHFSVSYRAIVGAIIARPFPVAVYGENFAIALSKLKIPALKGKGFFILFNFFNFKTNYYFIAGRAIICFNIPGHYYMVFRLPLKE